MKSIKQVWRQPVKTAAGILLTALAAAALCVCAGQSFAAQATQEKLDETYLSIALPRGAYDSETDAWALAYAEAHPEVVASVGSPGLISASIDDVELINFEEGFHGDVENANSNFPYNRVLLEIEITEEPVVRKMATDVVMIDGEPLVHRYWDEMSIENGIISDRGSVELKGKVLNVFGLQAGYANPVGYYVTVHHVFRADEGAEKNFQMGQRYLVYGWDYQDLDYQLRSNIAKSRMKSDLYTQGKKYFAEHFEESDLIPIDDDYNSYGYVNKVRINDAYVGLTEADVNNFRRVFVNGYDMTDFRSYGWTEAGDKYEDLLFAGEYSDVINWIPHDDGKVYRTSFRYEADFIDTVSWISDDWKEVQIPYGEYHEKYPFLTLVELSGTAEEFLNSDEGAPWRAALEEMEVNNHAFAVIGVKDMLEITDLAMSKGEVVEGHAFTEEELKKGKKVCLISSYLARANGLEVGDEIHPSFYVSDLNAPNQKTLAARDDIVDRRGDYILLPGYETKDAYAYSNPNPYYYHAATTQLQARETYTIVGIYEAYEWMNEEDNVYCFTPNTIFVPASSVEYPMERGQWGFYRNFIITNGMMEEFSQAVVQAGYADAFYFNDNGYSAVENSMDAYRENANRAMGIGVCVYTVMFLVYMLLFPLRQKSVLDTMFSLGVPKGKRVNHVCISSLAVLLPGTAIGVGVSFVLWQRVKEVVLAEAASVLTVEMEPRVLVLLGAASLAVQMLAVLCAALPLTKGSGLKKRR